MLDRLFLRDQGVSWWCGERSNQCSTCQGPWGSLYRVGSSSWPDVREMLATSAIIDIRNE